MKTWLEKTISIMSVIALLLSGMLITPKFSQTVSAAENEEEIEWIEITNVSELYAIRNNLSGHYKLMNDIDLTEATGEGGEVNNTGHGWDPIDNFSGVLDGNGHYIKGMQIYGEVNDTREYIGLFGNAYSASIRNLGMIDVNIDVTLYSSNYNSNYYYCGAIAGEMGYYDTSGINNCFVSGKINISVSGSTQYSYTYVGGLGGCGKCANSYNLAEIDVASEGNVYAGGISGYNSNSTMKYCYSMGEINGGEGYAIGTSPGNETNYYLSGAGISYSNEHPLTETQMKNKRYFTDWDFDSIWVIDPYSNYKYPQLRSCLQTRIKSLEVVMPPTKTEYEQGEALNLEGATVKVTYEDGYETTIFLTEDMLGDYDMMKVGKQDIPIIKGNARTSIEINVNPIPVKEVDISKTSLSVYKGYSEQLSASVVPKNATYTKISWESENANIATVDQTGKVTGKNAGTTKIIARSEDGVTAECVVTVKVPCVLIQLDNYDITIDKGETYTPTYQMSPIDATDSITWMSSDESILHIDGENRFVGVDAGSVEVTGVADSGVSVICTVTVMQDLSEFTVLDLKDVTYTGKALTPSFRVTNGTKTLRAGVDYSVTYSSNVNVGKAKVEITGLRPYKGTLTREFNILPIPVQAVDISRTSLSIYKGDTEQLSASVVPEDATYTDILWESEDETIAEVDQTGKVKGINAGTTAIIARSEDGVEAKCQVTVGVPCTELILDSYDITMDKGDVYIPKYQMLPADTTDSVTWTSSDESVLYIDDENQFVGVDVGSVEVTATADSGVSIVCTVTVMQDLSEFTILDLKPDMTYTGSPITQIFKVSNGTKTLREDVDYSVTYSSNVNVGKAVIEITGLRPYKGTLTGEFNILPIPVQTVDISCTSLSIYKGDTEQLSASVVPEDATYTDILWESEDETIAEVDQTGKVKGINAGTTAIIARSEDGVEAKCQVTVGVPCTELILDSYDITMDKGDVYIPKYQMLPADTTDSITWTSSDESVLYIDDENQFVGVDAGSVEVTATADSGVSIVCTVTVMQDLSEFTILDLKPDMTYTGSPITQIFKVSNGTKTLREDIDYSVTYSSNVNVGKAVIEITGVRPYKGTLTGEFNIFPSGETIPDDSDNKTEDTNKSDSDSKEEDITKNESDTTNTTFVPASKKKLSKAHISSVQAAKKKLTIKWRKVSGAGWYQISVAKNKAFTKGKKTYVVGANTRKKAVMGKRRTTYYVRVRACALNETRQRIYGKWSSKKKKKTK